MVLKYEIKDTGNSFRLGISSYTLVEVMYSTERCTTPMEKDGAEKLIGRIKGAFEFDYPVETLNEEDYEPSEFYKMMESVFGDDDSDCDDDSCDSTMGRDLMKMMFLKAMMD